MEQGQVFGGVGEAGVLAVDTVTDHRRRLPHHRRIVGVTVAALRALERLLRAAAAVEPVALEVSDRLDDCRQVAPRHRRVTACPTDRVDRRADGHLKHVARSQCCNKYKGA